MANPLNRVKCANCGHINVAGETQCSVCSKPLPRVQIRMDLPPEPPVRPEMQQIAFHRGQVIARRYTVLEMIGRGGMGCIYKVHDNTLKEEVALKTLLPQFAQDKTVVERFYNEARIARSLSHPNVVRVHDIGIAGSILYISMEYVKGQSLRGVLDRLAPGQRLPLKQTLQYIDELCAALEYAHQYTVHRDIKPENVMLTDTNVVKLMDFGISKLVTHTQLTAASVVMGTPHYMSPEQLRDSASVDARSDVYSVGVVLYEVLTGNLPTGVPKPASAIMQEVPRSLDPIIAKCMDPDPKHRFQSIHELRQALRPIRELVAGDESLPSLRPMGAGQATVLGGGAAPSSRKALGMALALAAIVLAGVGIVGVEQRRVTGAERLAPAALSPNGDDAMRANYERLLVVLDKVKVHAQRMAENDEDIQALIALGERRFELAQGAERSGQLASSEALAWEALECYAAPLMRPEGMVFVPPGEAVIPTDSGECRVQLSGFFIEEHEVTNEDFMNFAQAVEGGWRLPPWFDAQNPNVPATGLTYYDALAYAAHYNKKLPSEAQWARAAYGAPDASQLFPWGDEPRNELANTALGDEHSALAPVGYYVEDRSAFGCYDMLGNACEWTRSPSTADPCATSEADTAQATFGSLFVVRGGSYFQDGMTLSSRSSALFEEVQPFIGFRCVQEFPRDLTAIERLL